MADTPSNSSNPKNNQLTHVTGLFDLAERTLGDFRMLRRLGRGGMAEVWLAEQTSLKRPVAVKILRPEFVTDPSYIKRFEREAAAAGALNHPNIVQVYIVGSQDGMHFIAQEYVQGRTLKDLITRKGHLDLPVAIAVMRQVASALQVAGSAGIVHRDIKPENILITKKGEVKVADFGLAQTTLSGEGQALTQVGTTMGTPLYMSPEQISGKALDPRSDIYSFGIMCWHMLAGKPPFSGENAYAVAVHHLNDEPPKLKEVRADLPPLLCEIIHKMIAKKKEDRYADAQAILNAMKPLMRPTANAPVPIDKPKSTTPTKKSFLDRPVRSHILPVVLLALLGGGASAGIGWVTRVQDPLNPDRFVGQKPRRSVVPVQATAQAQYFYAMSHADDEEAWNAVLQNFPQSQLETQHAELHLAVIYLKSLRMKQAEEIFDRFAAGSSWQRAHGMVGQAYLAFLDHRTDESRRLLSQAEQAESNLDAVVRPLIREMSQKTSAR